MAVTAVKIEKRARWLPGWGAFLFLVAYGCVWSLIGDARNSLQAK